jgi:uncharacterized protein
MGYSFGIPSSTDGHIHLDHYWTGPSTTDYAVALIFRRDRRKATANLAKHGISFEEASAAFGNPLSITIEDLDHSYGENRHIVLEERLEHHLVIVTHADRNGEIRIISARLATR